MSNQLLTLLRTRRTELDSIESSMSAWNQIKEWHSGAKPIITKCFGDQLDTFNDIINIQWASLPRVGLTVAGQQSNDKSRADAIQQLSSRTDTTERSLNDTKVKNVRNELLRFIDTLIELSDIDIGNADTQETDRVFAEINRLVAESAIPQQFKDIVASDLTDAQIAYRGGSFKGCVVMLGAVLEGLMLGTLQRTDVLGFLVAHPNPPRPIEKLGKSDPQLVDKIGEKLNFEDYKVCICSLIPGVATLNVENIQSFRNAIHPWKSIQEPKKYGTFHRSHALNFIGALQQIVEAICKWTPTLV